MPQPPNWLIQILLTLGLGLSLSTTHFYLNSNLAQHIFDINSNFADSEGGAT